MILYKVQKYFNLNLDATVCNSAAAPEISSYFENTFILVNGYSFVTSLAPQAVRNTCSWKGQLKRRKTWKVLSWKVQNEIGKIEVGKVEPKLESLW